jgi:hypothetical protein
MTEVDRLAAPPLTAATARATVNRRESPILPFGLSDEDVIGRWLAAKATGRWLAAKATGRWPAPTTLAQYRTEAERLFWYAGKVGAPISTWTMDEFAGYVGFLQAPAPWAVRRPGVGRGSPDWRPFLEPPVGPLRWPDPENCHLAVRLAARRRLPAAQSRYRPAGGGSPRPGKAGPLPLSRRHCAAARGHFNPPRRGVEP